MNKSKNKANKNWEIRGFSSNIQSNDVIYFALEKSVKYFSQLNY